MSDVTYLSPSRLATYLDCQRKFDYKYVQEISTPDKSRLYLNQGQVYHQTIEDVCEASDPDDDAVVIHRRAMETFTEKWAEHADPDEYESLAHQEYQREENRAAVAAFFDPDDGDGIEHARRSVATEKWVECVRDGYGLHGKADNVLRTEDGLHLIDYKRTVDGIITSYTAKYLEEHLRGETYETARVKNALQTATYIEGIKQSDLYEDGMEIRFTFYGLLHYREFDSSPDGYEISVRSHTRETTDVYEDYHETIWELIRTAHDGITDGHHNPDPFDLINEEACPECDYREMCPEYISVEVRR